MGEDTVKPAGAWLPGGRWLLPLCILGGGVLACWRLALKDPEWKLTPGGTEVISKFLSAAVHPATDYESPPVDGAVPFMARILRGALDTLRFAGAAVTLSVIGGFILAFLGSAGRRPDGKQGHGWGRITALVFSAGARAFITVSRSLHELIWALLLLAALGFTPMAAILAIAIPYSGTLAKGFMEIAGHTPEALRHPFPGFILRALPDILRRFESGLRSATVLGFMGFSTLGLHLQQSFDNADYRESWTCLYAMLLMVLLFNRWSAAIRRSLSSGLTPLPRPDTTVLKRHFFRISLWLLCLFAAISLFAGFLLEIRWTTGTQNFSGVFSTEDVHWTLNSDAWDRHAASLHRFLGEITPAPLVPETGVTWLQWITGIGRYALPAALTTLWISLASIVLAMVAAWMMLPFVSPAAIGPTSSRAARLFRQVVRQTVNALHVIAGALPVVILAFLLLAVVAGNVWPAVLALSIYHFGAARRSRAEPLSACGTPEPPGFASSFFDRWGSALRDATALGIPGGATLGYYIQELRFQFRHNEMLAVTGISAALVILCSILSSVCRHWTRTAK
jgi:phosphonate transport system permease protein